MTIPCMLGRSVGHTVIYVLINGAKQRNSNDKKIQPSLRWSVVYKVWWKPFGVPITSGSEPSSRDVYDLYVSGQSFYWINTIPRSQVR